MLHRKAYFIVFLNEDKETVATALIVAESLDEAIFIGSKTYTEAGIPVVYAVGDEFTQDMIDEVAQENGILFSHVEEGQTEQCGTEVGAVDVKQQYLH